MDGTRKLAYSLLCLGLAFVGVVHVVFSTVFGYGFRQVGVLLVAAGVFGLGVLDA